MEEEIIRLRQLVQRANQEKDEAVQQAVQQVIKQKDEVIKQKDEAVQQVISHNEELQQVIKQKDEELARLKGVISRIRTSGMEAFQTMRERNHGRGEGASAAAGGRNHETTVNDAEKRMEEVFQQWSKSLDVDAKLETVQELMGMKPLLLAQASLHSHDNPGVVGKVTKGTTTIPTTILPPSFLATLTLAPPLTPAVAASSSSSSSAAASLLALLTSSNKDVKRKPEWMPYHDTRKSKRAKEKTDIFTHERVPGYFYYTGVGLPVGQPVSVFARWKDEDFISHLATAESASIDGKEIWSRIMNYGVDPFLSKFVRGHYKETAIPVASELDTEINLTATVLFTLAVIFAGALPEAKFRAGTGSHDGNNKPGLASTRKVDRVLEILVEGKAVVFVIKEIKPDFKFPCLKSALDKFNETLGTMPNLIDFYEVSETGKLYMDKNVLAQIRTYMAIYHRRFGIVCSLNSWTFVMLDEDGTLHVSRRFSAYEPVPDEFAGPLLEILMRFIVAGIGKYKAGGRPWDCFERRPKFLRDQFGDEDEDFEPYGPPAPSSSGKAKPGANSSSSGSGAAAATKGTSSSSASSKQHRNMVWTDLEDPRRNAADSTLTWEEHLSALGTLEGDAEVIAHARTGWVLRKTFGGEDIAIKLLMAGAERDRDGPTGEELLKELQHEGRVYEKLSELQGQVIPRCFGFQDFGHFECYALLTEYHERTLAAQPITEVHAQSALDALDKLHEHGVLHGDIANLHNILWDSASERALIIDLALSTLRDDFPADLDWNTVVKSERQTLWQALQEVLPQTKGRRDARKRMQKPRSAKTTAAQEPMQTGKRNARKRKQEQRTRRTNPNGGDIPAQGMQLAEESQ